MINEPNMNYKYNKNILHINIENILNWIIYEKAKAIFIYLNISINLEMIDLFDSLKIINLKIKDKQYN